MDSQGVQVFEGEGQDPIGDHFRAVRAIKELERQDERARADKRGIGCALGMIGWAVQHPWPHHPLAVGVGSILMGLGVCLVMESQMKKRKR